MVPKNYIEPIRLPIGLPIGLLRWCARSAAQHDIFSEEWKALYDVLACKLKLFSEDVLEMFGFASDSHEGVKNALRPLVQALVKQLEGFFAQLFKDHQWYEQFFMKKKKIKFPDSCPEIKEEFQNQADEK